MVNRRPFPRSVRPRAPLARRARKALALALTFLLTHGFAAGLVAPPAHAQSTAEGGDASAPSVSVDKGAGARRRGFVIRKGGDGSECDVATPEQVEALFPRGASAATELRQINHLGDLTSNAPGDAQAEAATGLTIILRASSQLDNPNNQTAVAAKAAFIRAASHWEALIKSPITVVVDVDFGTSVFGQPFDDPNILGATFVQEYPTLYPALANSLKLTPSTSAETTLYNSLPLGGGVPSNLGPITQMYTPTAVLRALGELPPVADTAKELGLTDVSKIGFNASFDFDFDPSNGVQLNQVDFDSVGTLEIGHALGFSSQSGVNNLEPTARIMSSWDLFRFGPGTASLSNFATAQRLLTNNSGAHVYFDGGSELQLSTGDPEGNGGDGEQASHWKDNRFGIPFIGIMDPTISDGVHEDINANDLRAADHFGYVLTGETAPALPSASNDAFASAELISTATGSDSTNTRAATLDAGEPNHVNAAYQLHPSPSVPQNSHAGGKSIWYKWTPTTSGTANISTTNSNYDTVLTVFRGTALNNLVLVEGNDDESSGQVSSRVSFTATTGNTYYIAVDGFDGTGGDAVLNWSLPSGSSGASTIQFSSATYSVAENVGGVNITVTRGGDLSASQNVTYSTSNGSAVVGDYAPSSGIMTFAPGESSKNFSVSIFNDTAVEGNETVNLELTNPTNGASVGTLSTAVLTIVDDDFAPPPSVQLSASAVTVAEGAGSVTLTVTRTGDTSIFTNVSYSTFDGTAFGGSDYTPRSDNFTFGAGETSRQITIQISNDTTPEPSETFSFALTGVTAGSVIGSPATAVVTITDNDPVPVNSVQFSTDHVDVNEGVGSVTVTVTRTGDTSGAAEVGYSTANETASDRRDYLMSVGTLRFAPGETSKTITVFIINDVYGNGDTGGIGDIATESFVVVLTNSVLTNIGATPLVRVNIANDETADGANPVKGQSVVPAFFARQHYLDFLNREPDSPGLAFWTGQVTGCGNADLLVCRINVSAAFFLSGEFQETGFYVIRAQRAAYGKRSTEVGSRVDYVSFLRDARQVGEGFVDGQPGAGQILENNKNAYAAQIVSSGEFTARYAGAQDATSFVNALFATASVVPTAAERQEAINAYNDAAPFTVQRRAAAFRKVTDSASVRNAEFRGAFVLMEYFGYMRRDPDEGGYNFWLGKLNEFGGNYISAEMVKAFITSGEYLSRFGPS